MKMKKLLRSGLAVLCIASMMLGYFGGLAPESKVEAAETVETMPTDFTEVTPKDFGIDDFSGNTGTTHEGSLTPVDSLHKVIFKTNVVWGAGKRIDYLKNSATGGGLGLQANGNLIVSNYLSLSAGIYVGGRFDEENNYVDGTYYGYNGNSRATHSIHYTNISTTENFNTAEVSLAITTEVINFDNGTSANDLKIGIWCNEKLCDNTFIYFRDCVSSTTSMYLKMTTQSSSSPFATAPATAQDGYRVVTPATFGISDSTSGTRVSKETPSKEDGTYNTYDIDKVMFTTKVKYDSTINGHIQYLYSESGIYQLQLMVSASGYNGLGLYNYFVDGGDMYVGGHFDENGTYQQGEYEPIPHGSYYELSAALAGYTDNKYYLKINEYLLSVTTDLIDLDKDDNNDDLQLGVYINGKLYGGIYFYLLDAKAAVCQERLSTSNLLKITSPMMELDDLGLTGGEYAGNNTDFTLSTVATSKVINGTTVQSDVLFKEVGGTLNYGFGGNTAEKTIQLTSTADGIQVSYTDGTVLEDIVLLNKNNVGIDVVNNAFNLKLTTDVVASDSDQVENDIKLGIQVNDKYSCFYLHDIATTDMSGATMSIQCAEGATIAFGRFKNATPVDVAHCLDDGAYAFDSASGASRVSVNGIGQDANFALEQPGEYYLAVTKNREVTWEIVTIYYRYDVNDSDAFDIKDLIHMKKIQDKDMQTIAALTKVGKLAIWYNEENWSDVKTEATLDLMRNKMVETSADREVKITAIDEAQLAQFAHQSGAFTGDFAITVDLAEAIDADLINIYEV